MTAAREEWSTEDQMAKHSLDSQIRDVNVN